MIATLLEVGETALVPAGLLVPGFFFLILIPGTGAEFRASRKPVHSIAAMTTQGSSEHHSCYSTIILLIYRYNLILSSHVCSHLRCAGMILTLISLAELEGVFRGLYFFSRGGASNGPELQRENKHKRAHVSTNIQQLRAAVSWLHAYIT